MRRLGMPLEEARGRRALQCGPGGIRCRRNGARVWCARGPHHHSNEPPTWRSCSTTWPSIAGVMYFPRRRPSSTTKLSDVQSDAQSCCVEGQISANAPEAACAPTWWWSALSVCTLRCASVLAQSRHPVARTKYRQMPRRTVSLLSGLRPSPRRSMCGSTRSGRRLQAAFGSSEHRISLSARRLSRTARGAGARARVTRLPVVNGRCLMPAVIIRPCCSRRRSGFARRCASLTGLLLPRAPAASLTLALKPARRSTWPNV